MNDLKVNLNLKYLQNNFFYGYKGLVGRFAPIFVHISLILVLLGALQGTFQGFTAQELVPKTEIFHIQNLIKKGKLSQLNSLNMRVNDFWIQYDDNKTIKQFYSYISDLIIYLNCFFPGLSYYIDNDWPVILHPSMLACLVTSITLLVSLVIFHATTTLTVRHKNYDVSRSPKFC